MIDIIIPGIASVTSIIFAVITLDQYLSNRKPYKLVWFFGLLLYFISTGCAFLIELKGFNSQGFEPVAYWIVVYRLWYICGATLVAAYLGMGMIYLLAPRRIAHIVMIVLGLATISAIVLISTASVDFSLLPESGLLLSGDALSPNVRLLTPFFNVFGTIALVGGAAYSAWHYWSRRIMRHRVLSNILIAVGAVLPAVGGLFARQGYPSLLYWSELLGIVLIFAGFLRNYEVFDLTRLRRIYLWRRHRQE
jgi:hypothetical protein